MKLLGLLLFACTLCLLAPHSGSAQNKVLNTVTNETVEKILQSLNIKFQKTERKEKDTFSTQFDFKRGDQTFRLYNYGGNDLWIECNFDKKWKLEDVNRWNAEAKFCRSVLLEQKEKTVISLESQLDCLAGVTEQMIKQFINRFEEDAKKFVKLLPK